jgi:hypothetical protein
MTTTKVKTTKITKIRKGISGYFKLTDGTKTKFSIDNQGEWEQWGNTTDNLCISVPNVQRMVTDLIFNY